MFYFTLKLAGVTCPVTLTSAAEHLRRLSFPNPGSLSRWNILVLNKCVLLRTLFEQCAREVVRNVRELETGLFRWFVAADAHK